jgi:regulator of nucleoside diphosphate kinase
MEIAMSGNVNPPPVMVHSRDNNELVLCATLASGLGNHGAQFLLNELRRATLCAVEALPADVVSLGSRITYRVDGAAPKTCTLMLPGELDRSRDSLSVLTPLGAALIGLRVGARMPFLSGEGVASEVRVVRVENSVREDENSYAALDHRLDQALDETFPASDPVSVVCHRVPARTHQGGDAAMTTATPRVPRPDIVIAQAEARSLANLAATVLGRSADVGEELLAEIERACIVPGVSVPHGVVRMGSIVEFRQEGGRIRRVQLVYPGQADIAANRISILTPIGTALLGLREGQSIEWKTRDGRRCRLSVISVRPECGTAPVGA